MYKQLVHVHLHEAIHTCISNTYIQNIYIYAYIYIKHNEEAGLVCGQKQMHLMLICFPNKKLMQYFSRLLIRHWICRGRVTGRHVCYFALWSS